MSGQSSSELDGTLTDIGYFSAHNPTKIKITGEKQIEAGDTSADTAAKRRVMGL